MKETDCQWLGIIERIILSTNLYELFVVSLFFSFWVVILFLFVCLFVFLSLFLFVCLFFAYSNWSSVILKIIYSFHDYSGNNNLLSKISYWKSSFLLAFPINLSLKKNKRLLAASTTKNEITNET